MFDNTSNCVPYKLGVCVCGHRRVVMSVSGDKSHRHTQTRDYQRPHSLVPPRQWPRRPQMPSQPAPCTAGTLPGSAAPAQLATRVPISLETEMNQKGTLHAASPTSVTSLHPRMHPHREDLSLLWTPPLPASQGLGHITPLACLYSPAPWTAGGGTLVPAVPTLIPNPPSTSPNTSGAVNRAHKPLSPGASLLWGRQSTGRVSSAPGDSVSETHKVREGTGGKGRRARQRGQAGPLRD